MKGQKSFIHADRMHWQSVEGEENLWATVEDPNDIYDLRVADQSVYWINLEKIMGGMYSRIFAFENIRHITAKTFEGNFCIIVMKIYTHVSPIM